MALALALAVLIGLSLALLGGGGSIITVPVLVYAAGYSPREAVPMSLAIVGGVSLLGTIQKARRGLVHWKAAGAFGGAGIPGALLGAQATALVSARALLLIFGFLMLGVALHMWRRPQELTRRDVECRITRCLAAGFGVGALTGFLGVGGGFLLVPALAYFALLPTPMAVGTSLAIIALNALGGLVGHWNVTDGQWGGLGWFLLAAVAGMLAGLPLTAHVSARQLNRAFALFVVLVAFFVIGHTFLRPAAGI